MIVVYVESNFVLDFALDQEQSEQCKDIVKLAQTHKIDLVFPSYSLIEPFWTLGKWVSERKELCNRLSSLLNQFSRSPQYSDMVNAMHPLVDQISSAGSSESQRLRDAIEILLKNGRAIELGSDVIGKALEYQLNLDMPSQDSIVLASIVNDLGTRPSGAPKVFLCFDRRHFGDTSVRDEMDRLACRIIYSADDCLAYIRRNL